MGCEISTSMAWHTVPLNFIVPYCPKCKIKIRGALIWKFSNIPITDILAAKIILMPIIRFVWTLQKTFLKNVAKSLKGGLCKEIVKKVVIKRKKKSVTNSGFEPWPS